MFGGFFFFLRERGLNVSLNEWLLLMDALEKDLVKSNLTEFYYVARAILTKDESEFDTFDGAFLEYFGEIRSMGAGISKELIDKIEKQDRQINIDVEYIRDADDSEQEYTDQEIIDILEEAPNEQTLEHNSKSQALGAGGASFFGHEGSNSKGIRVGGFSKNKTAFEVAGERNFRDFRYDKVLNVNQYQMALNRLRQYSARLDAPKTELDLNETVNETGQHAGMLNIVYQRPRQNTVKVMMLMDSGGSMRYYSNLCGALFQALNKSNHFKDIKFFYFHNCVYAKLYTDPACRHGYWVETQWVLNSFKSDYKVIFVGDAAMHPDELLEPSYYKSSVRDDIPGIEWLRRFLRRYRNVVWLNPEPPNMTKEDGHTDRFVYSQETRRILESEFDMYLLTVANIQRALKKLASSK